MRCVLVVTLGVLTLGCEPAFELGEAHGARAVTRLPPSSSEEASASQRASNREQNEAAILWGVQEEARQRGWHIARDEARRGLAWLRVADARAGTLTEAPDGSWSLKPGGEALHVIRRDGVSFDVRVLAMEGAISDADFPRVGDTLKTEVEFNDGRSWECTLTGEAVEGTDEAQVRTHCAGRFGVEAFTAAVDAVEHGVVEVFSTPYGTRVGGESSIEGTVDVGGVQVRFTASDEFANCSDVSRCAAFSERVSMSSHLSGEKFDTAVAWERAVTVEVANAPANVEWSGTITRGGIEVGAMQKRALIEDRVALDVTVDGETFTTQTVFGN